MTQQELKQLSHTTLLDYFEWATLEIEIQASNASCPQDIDGKLINKYLDIKQELLNRMAGGTVNEK